METIYVTITSVNDELNKTEVKRWDDCEDLRNACRLIQTYRPKRGYKVVHYEIENLMSLV